MSSYWWSLGRAPAAPAAAAPTASTSGPSTSIGKGGGGAASSTTADMRHLAQTAFHTSLDSLLVEATKHRSLVLLRDAVQETRQRRYDPLSLFNTLCIACSLLAERSGAANGRSFSNASSDAFEGARRAVLRSTSGANGSHAGGMGGSAPSDNAHLAASLSGLSMTGAPAAATAASGPAGVLGSGAYHTHSPGSAHALHYRHHGTARHLLLQSIGDVGKLIALGILPVTLAVGQRVADLVREIAFVPNAAASSAAAAAAAAAARATRAPSGSSGAVSAGTRPSPPPPSHAAAAAAAATMPPAVHVVSPKEGDLPPPRLDPTTAAVDACPVQLVNDDPVLVRLLQLTASAASVCPLGSPALPELYGVLILFYSGVAPQSMLEATCEATLTHHIHTVLEALRNSRNEAGHGNGNSSAGVLAAGGSHGVGAANDGGPSVATTSAGSVGGADGSALASPFTAQLHGIAFMKDICRLMVGARTRWLHLSQQRSTSAATSADNNNNNNTNQRSTTATGERSGEPPVPRKPTSASSSMAAVTASVVAAAADAERQQQQQQQHQQAGRTPHGASLTSTPMTAAIASANREASLASFGSPLAASYVSGAGGNGGNSSAVDSPPFSASPMLTTSGGAAPAPSSAMECVPERLRAFLMRAVTLYFKEQAKVSASPLHATTATTTTTAAVAAGASQAPTSAPGSHGAPQAQALPMESPLYVQCLNDCLFSVALWGMYEMDITVPMQPPPSLFVEVMQQQYTASHSNFICSLELFTCTQQLAMATMSTNLASMTNAAQILMEAHERLLQRLHRKQKLRGAARSPVRGRQRSNSGSSGGGGATGEVLDAYAERLSQAAIAVLTLWRKTLTSSTLLCELQQLRSTSGQSSSAAARGGAMGSGGGLDDRTPSMMMMMEPSLASLHSLGSHAGKGKDNNNRSRAAFAASASFFDDHVQHHHGRQRSSSFSSASSSSISSYEHPHVNNDNNDAHHDDSGTHKYDSESDEGQEGNRPPATNAAGGAAANAAARSSASPDPASKSRNTAKTSTRARPRPQPLTLARPRGAAFLDPSHPTATVASVDVDSYEEDGSHDEGAGDGVGSPRLEMAPLARFVISVVNLTMAYMQAPQQQPPQQQRPSSSSLEVGLTGAGDTGAVPLDAPPRRRRSHRTPLLPFCMGASPHTVYQCLTEAINFLTVFGQYMCQLAEQHSSGGAGTPAAATVMAAMREGQTRNEMDDNTRRRREQVLRRSAAWFLDLHPYLLRCGSLCLRYLRYEEDVLPVLLKGIGYWVQVSCALQLTEQRDAYLYLLLRALRMPDPVVGHLIALSPPTALVSAQNTNSNNSRSGAKAGVSGNAKLSTGVGYSHAAGVANTGSNSGSSGDSSPSPTVLLAALIELHDHYEGREPVVPGSVAAAALRGENIGDFRDPSPTGGHGRSRAGASSFAAAAATSSSSAAGPATAAGGMSTWGIGWLRRRTRTSLSASNLSSRGATTRTVSPAQAKAAHSATSAAATSGDGVASTSTAMLRGDGPDPQRRTPLSSATPPAAKTDAAVVAGATVEAAAASPFAMELASLGWRAPAVQHVVVLAVCRLQHKILIMKTLHVIANALGPALDGGWALLARGTALTEPLLHLLKRLLTWIEESSVEEEQQDQLLSDALHLRDALRSLCVNCTCRLPYAQLNIFFSGLVNGTASLSPSAPAVKKAAGLVMSGSSWSAGFNTDEAELDHGAGFPLDELYDLSESTSPYTIAYARLPRHDPQGCADQWVLTSECLSLSLLAMLPFTEQRVPDVNGATTPSPSAHFGEEATSIGNNSSGNSGVGGASTSGLDVPALVTQLQRQRAGALTRALRLWQLETDSCRYVMDAERVARWGTVLVTSTAAHQRVLLLCAAEIRQSAAALPQMPPPSALSEEEARVVEGTLTTIVDHVAAVAAHLCRSAARRRSADERDNAAAAALAGRLSSRGGAYNNSNNSSTPKSAAVGLNPANSVAISTYLSGLSYQALQSAALVLTAGPFAGVPLIQTANALFAAPASTPSPASAGRDASFSHVSSSGHPSSGPYLPSMLPFVQADATLSTASILYALQRTVQTSSLLNSYAAHRHETTFYTSPTRAFPAASSATRPPPDSRYPPISGGSSSGSPESALPEGRNGGITTVLDPAEQLLASPFALLDDVYHQWSQAPRAFAAHQRSSRKDDNNNSKGSGRNENDTSARDDATSGSTLQGTSTDLTPSQQQRQQHVNNVDEDGTGHSIDDSPPNSPLQQFGNTEPEMAAAAAVVAVAVPQLLMNAATAALMGVVKVVQAYGEDIDGAAWEPILSFLEHTATLGSVHLMSGSSEAPNLAATQQVDGNGQSTSTSGASGREGRSTVSAADIASTRNNTTDTNTAISTAQTVESLNTAFRALESIQHNHIPRLKMEGLHRLIVCIGAFTVHRIDGGVPGERKLHINLSAVQLLWSTADYLAAFGSGNNTGNTVVGSGTSTMAAATGGEMEMETPPPQQELGHQLSSDGPLGRGSTGSTALSPAQQQDRLWCSLLWQLRNGCLDDRQEIRQSAMQTFFALVQTYGWRFSGACWRCALLDVLWPLIEVASASTALCATPPPLQQSPASPVSPSPADKANSMTLANASASTAAPSSILQDPVVQLLLNNFSQQPAQLEDVRVTLYDAGSRLFVTHYANMQAALQQSPHGHAEETTMRRTMMNSPAARPASPAGLFPVYRTNAIGTGSLSEAGGAAEATRVLEALLQLCGDVCVVVRGTSGESSAIAAVHALHGLLVEMPGSGLHPNGVHLAWRALERLLYRGDDAPRAHAEEAPPDAVAPNATSTSANPADTPASAAVDLAPFAHTEVKQCTLAVVAAIVAAVCDSFRLQRMVAAAAAAAAAGDAADRLDRLHSTSVASLNASTTSPPTASGAGGESSALGPADRGVSASFGSYFTGWGTSTTTNNNNNNNSYANTATAATTASVKPTPLSTGRTILTSPDAQRTSPAQYFTRLLFALQAVTRCHAVVHSYYFPSKPQTTLLEGVLAVWPTLTSREARLLWGEVLLPAFPSVEAMERFVLQDVEALRVAADAAAGEASDSAAQQQKQQLTPLKAVLPPGSHPSYLSAVMDTMRSLLLLHMGIDTAASPSSGTAESTAAANNNNGSSSFEDDRTRLLFMAPSTVHVTGALLLLHLASPAVLTGPPRTGGVPYTLPALFLQECGDLLQFTLWGPVLSRGPAAQTSNNNNNSSFGGKSTAEEREKVAFASRQPSTLAGVDSSLPAAAAAARCRREGVATLCRAFEALLATTVTVVRAIDAAARVRRTSSSCSNSNPASAGPSANATPQPSSPATAATTTTTTTVVTTTTTAAIPPYVTTALQSLDRLVDTLGEVVRLVMEQYEDVAAAAEAINALSVASTAEGVALTRVAKRSLALLQRWADAVGSASAGVSAVDAAPQPPVPRTELDQSKRSHTTTGVGKSTVEPAVATSRSQLQDVVRASMEARNKAIMRQYIDNPDDGSGGALLADTLRDMLRVAQNEAEAEQRHAQSEDGSGGRGETAATTFMVLEQWDCVMPELLQLVGCCSREPTRSAAAMAREKEVREALSSLLAVLHERRRRQWSRQRPTSGSAAAAPSVRASTTSTPPQQQRKRNIDAEVEEAMSII